jgi:molybdenum cofactor cytidylyltransferase
VTIGAIVLAAGRSTRMGGPNKLLAEADGKPLVRHVVEAALRSTAAVAVVTGHAHADVEAALAGLRVPLVHNPRYAEGMATSLQAGIGALSPRAKAALVLLGDMPRVSTALIDRLIAAFRAAPDCAALVPTHRGQRGNPVLLSRSLFPAIMALKGDAGARGLLRDLPGVVELPVDDPGILLDIDTPEALATLRGGAFPK